MADYYVVFIITGINMQFSSLRVTSRPRRRDSRSKLDDSFWPDKSCACQKKTSIGEISGQIHGKQPNQPAYTITGARVHKTTECTIARDFPTSTVPHSENRIFPMSRNYAGISFRGNEIREW